MGKKTKKLRMMLGIGLLASLLAGIFALAGCGKAGLPRPSGVYVDDISQYLTLYWNNVRNADKYEIELNGNSVEVRRSSLSLDDLEPDTYTIRVRALGDGMLYSDSAW